MLFHVGLLFFMSWLIKAPTFFPSCRKQSEYWSDRLARIQGGELARIGGLRVLR